MTINLNVSPPPPAMHDINVPFGDPPPLPPNNIIMRMRTALYHIHAMW